MKNTRSEIITGKDFSMFIDGMPNDHECNSNGDVIYTTRSGKIIKWNTHKEWASMTTMAREPLIIAHYEEICDPILQMSCSCSICKVPLSAQMVWW